MKAICVGCGQEFGNGLEEYEGHYDYGDRQMFCDACQRHPIKTVGKIIVHKSDIDFLKKLLK